MNIGKKATAAYFQAAISELDTKGTVEINALGAAIPTAVELSAYLAKMGHKRTKTDIVTRMMPIQVFKDNKWIEVGGTHEVCGLMVVHEK